MRKTRSRRALWVGGLLLLSAWIVPDVWSDRLVFPISSLATSRGADLAGLVAPPIAASALMALAVLRLEDRLWAALCLGAGLAGLALPLLLGAMALPVRSGVILAAALAAAGLSARLLARRSAAWSGWIPVALVPAGLLATALAGMAAGVWPAAHLAPLKAPLAILGAELAIAEGGRILLAAGLCYKSAERFEP